MQACMSSLEMSQSAPTTRPNPEEDFAADIAAIARIDAVRTILEVVCKVTGMGFAAVARVTEDRWIACEVRDEIGFGLRSGGELPVKTTICDEIRASGQGVVIDHVAEDTAFRDHHTPARYGLQSYISLPIYRRNGDFFGTLCAIDSKPAKVSTPQTVSMFKLFAELIAFYLDAEDRLTKSEAALLTERQTAELREQFIAVLGHDLRNPLASIRAGVGMLTRPGSDPNKLRTIAALMQNSVTRMVGLVENLMDFARGRLGGGFAIQRDATRPLQPALLQVIEELRSAWPEREVVCDFMLQSPVDCDPDRIAQLLSNLVFNALAHGAPDQPVLVDAAAQNGVFTLSVTNQGAPIPAAVAANLFKPFFRNEPQKRGEGLGLGLYIVAEIARAHDGSVSVDSTLERTRFTFTMPA
jgi:signal transduction histidine kinase